MGEIVKEYENDDIIVYWRPEICEHAGKCVKGAPEVFEVGRRPWIKLELGGTELITSVIDQCPSGALTYKRK